MAFGRKVFVPEHRVNHKIRAREVLVIAADGQSKGVMQVSDAIILARQSGLDLVEVAPNARPPVCKVLDYGKFRYEEAKRERESKKGSTADKVKELKFHVNIEEHDYMTKMRHAEGFMMKGMKVKIVMIFRGREMQHQNIGKALVTRIRGDLIHIGVADSEPKLVGKNITMMLTPLPANKRVRKYTTEHDTEDEEETVENTTE